MSSFSYFVCSNPSQISCFMGQQSQYKREKIQNDLDQKISTIHVQTEEEKEKALVALITKIIVDATLKEYYETKSPSDDN